MYSKTNQPKTIPASSKSFIVNVPSSNNSIISFGHFCCHTVCGMCSSPGQMMPPAPSRHASVYWRNCGYCGTNSETGVGCLARCWTTVLQSCNDCLRVLVMVMNGGVVFKAACMGESKPFPPGMANEACCNLPAISWYVLRGQAFILPIFRISFAILMHLEGGSCMVYAAPSIIHPRISFVVAHVPSPCAIFF